MAIKTTAKYDRIRKTLETIYTYGTESRKRVQETGLMNVNTYDKVVREIYALFRDLPAEEDLIREQYREGEKFLGVNKSYFTDLSLSLAALYGLNAPGGVTLLMAALALTMEDKNKTTATALQLYAEQTAADALPSDATIRREAKGLQAAGYYPDKRAPGPGKGVRLRDLSEDALQRLYYLSVFFGSAGFPRVEGAFLSKTIRRELELRGKRSLPEAFLYRGNSIRSIFDEEMLYLFLTACRQGRTVEAKRDGVVRRYKPAFLRPDTRLGRWYVFCLCDESPAVIRLANLSEATLTKEKYEYGTVRRQVETAFSDSYISSGRYRETGAAVIEAELRFGDRTGEQREFERELLLGSVETREDGRQIYRAEVNDLGELRPFLRAYGDTVRVLPSETHGLDRELKEEWERMLTRYAADERL